MAWKDITSNFSQPDQSCDGSYDLPKVYNVVMRAAFKDVGRNFDKTMNDIRDKFPDNSFYEKSDIQGDLYKTATYEDGADKEDLSKYTDVYLDKLKAKQNRREHPIDRRNMNLNKPFLQSNTRIFNK